MRISSILYLSFRNYSRYLNRYSIILISLTIIIIIFTLLLSLSSGITNSVLSKSSRYFAGDIVLQALDVREGANRVAINNPSVLAEFIEDNKDQIKTFSKRSLYWRDHQLFFNGTYIKTRRLIGIDWENEETIIKEFSFHSGGIPSRDDQAGILISTVVASNLGAAVGDQVILRGVTENGQQNTHQFIVRGIFNEGSLFGYAAYVHRETLNEFATLPVDNINEMGIYLKNRSTRRTRSKLAQEMWNELNEKYEILPLLASRDDRYEYSDSPDMVGVSVFAILTLDAQVAEIIELLDTLLIIVYAGLLVLTVITSIGISNTFSLIVIERIKEVGTLRALGMRQGQVVQLFWGESIFLSISGIVLGTVFSLFILLIISNIRIDISENAFLSLFLKARNIPWNISLGAIVSIFFLAFLSCIAGCTKAVYKYAYIAPVDALRHE